MNMISRPPKDAAERAAFLAFVQLLGEADQWLAIENRKPPEPDLLCTHFSRGLIAFELVSITDPVIAKVNTGHARQGQAGFSTSDPSERIIRNKLKCKYVTIYPIELLVYNDLLVITPDDVIVDTILPWIVSDAHSFRRVWFMGEYNAQSIWNAG